MVPIRRCELTVLLLLLLAPVAFAQEKGDLWEVTTEMSMEGAPMAIPAQTHRSCSPREWKEPPGAKDDRTKCETIDFKTVGSKTSWKMRCAGPPAMTGEGEITRSGADAYTGSMRLDSPQGVMKMKLTGKRVGECDMAETRKERAEIEARSAKIQGDAAAAVAESCKMPIASMDLRAMNLLAEQCKDPKLKAEFCARLETREGFEMVAACANPSGNGIDDEAAYCGKDPAALTKAICTDALQKQNLDLVAKCCPEEAKAIAQRECAGRDYTSMRSSPYASFCVTYARQGLAEPPAEAEKPESKAAKAKKTLKGLFKR